MRKPPTDNGQQLGNLIERYKRILKPPQASVEKQAIETIANITGIVLQADQVGYQTGSRTLIIKAPSLVRSELLLSYDAILKALQAELGTANAPTHIS